MAKTHPLAGCPYCDHNLKVTNTEVRHREQDIHTYTCTNERCDVEMEVEGTLVDPRPN